MTPTEFDTLTLFEKNVILLLERILKEVKAYDGESETLR
jgi:hypothetical protein